MTALIELTDDEKLTLDVYEGVIRQGLESFIEVGNALMRIRDGRLYREKFSTFEEYCSGKWNLARQHVYRLVSAAEVAGDLSPMGDKNTPDSQISIVPQTERQARPLTQVPKEDRAAVWQEVVETAPKDADGEPKITAKHVEKVVNEKLGKPSPHVANNSGNNEWYTPPNILEAARAVLGAIDCDPASCETANANVQAKRIYTVDDCGLTAAKWGKRVWMNPPYAQPACTQFIESLADRFNRGEVEQAIVLVNNATETEWFGKLIAVASAVVFVSGRVKFLDSTNQPKGAPLQGQAIVYLGERFTAFLEGFKHIGWGAITQ